MLTTSGTIETSDDGRNVSSGMGCVVVEVAGRIEVVVVGTTLQCNDLGRHLIIAVSNDVCIEVLAVERIACYVGFEACSDLSYSCRKP